MCLISNIGGALDRLEGRYYKFLQPRNDPRWPTEVWKIDLHTTAALLGVERSVMDSECASSAMVFYLQALRENLCKHITPSQSALVVSACSQHTVRASETQNLSHQCLDSCLFFYAGMCQAKLTGCSLYSSVA